MRIMTRGMMAAAICALSACPKKSSNTVPTPEPEPEAAACAEYGAPDGAEKWMTWEDGIDFVGVTDPSLPGPNVLIHVARTVKTPVGEAPSGMILYQPDPKGQPVVMGYVSSDSTVGAYFGPNIFGGTPFEQAPVLDGTIEVTTAGDTVTSKTTAGGHVFEVEMTGLGEAAAIDREPGQMTPFTQGGTEAAPASVTVKVDGEPIEVQALSVGLSGGPGAVYAPCGVYAR